MFKKWSKNILRETVVFQYISIFLSFFCDQLEYHYENSFFTISEWGYDVKTNQIILHIWKVGLASCYFRFFFVWC